MVDPEVADITRAGAEELVQAAGLTFVDRKVTFTDALRVWLTAGTADLWTDLEQGMFPERAGDFTSIVRVGLERSQDVTVPQFARRLRWRKQLETEMAQLFDDIDVLLTPTTAVPAFAAEGPLPTEIAGQEVAPGMVVPFTMLANLCWNPAVSVPAGLSSDGLPVGLQIVGRRHADDVVLRLARIFEQARPWPRHAPGPTGDDRRHGRPPGLPSLLRPARRPGPRRSSRSSRARAPPCGTTSAIATSMPWPASGTARWATGGSASSTPSPSRCTSWPASTPSTGSPTRRPRRSPSGWRGWPRCPTRACS